MPTRPHCQGTPTRCRPGLTGREHQHGADQATLATITGMVPIRPRWQGTQTRCRSGHAGREHRHGADPGHAGRKHQLDTNQATLAGNTGMVPGMPAVSPVHPGKRSFITP
ncbi:MAG: hypothetical protein IPH35_13640 [Rhodoferax sp.]|nr:hypothetical protein [Rhodoferax sp.]